MGVEGRLFQKEQRLQVLRRDCDQDIETVVQGQEGGGAGDAEDEVRGK